MITKNGAFKCDSCGKFIGENDSKAICFTFYGGSFDTEPPEEEHECGKCTEAWTDKTKQYLEKYTLRKPTRLFPATRKETEE